nr:MAG TPA: hypothetical protein [Bacteriophage sp.]
MWVFEATYENMDCDSFIISVKRKIKFNGNNFFNTEDECYRYALEQTLKMKQKNECLGCLEFIAC